MPLAATDARSRVYRGIYRVVGTAVGLAVTAAVLVPGFSPTLLAAFAIVLIFPTGLYLTRSYGLAIGFFTPLIMLMTEPAVHTDAMTLLVDRVIGTLIGVAAGIAVAVANHRPSSATRVRKVTSAGLCR